MDAGVHTPLLDLFRRGEVGRDIRLLAAQGALGLPEDEQRNLLTILVSDQDTEIARTAEATLLVSLLEQPSPGASPGESTLKEGEPHEKGPALERIAAMTPAQRMALAMRGTREERAILIRDPNKIVAMAVLSSPRMTDAEVEGIAKMTNVSDEVLRIIGNTRAWVKSYGVVVSLTRNPKTPLAVSMNLLSRLNEKDVKMLSADRNIPDVLRLAAGKKVKFK